MVYILLIIQIGFILSITRSILFWMSLWQLKEYRLDRVLIHFRETNQGKQLFFAPLLLIKLSAILLYFFVATNVSFLFFYEVAVALVFLFDGVTVFDLFRTHMMKRPILTIKACFIMALTLFIVGLLLIFPPMNWFFWLLVLDVLAPLLIFFLVQIFALPTFFYKHYLIAKATKKIASHKNLIVIGVTGSFGKSSTKEYIAQVLGNKFEVLSTPGTNNTPIGIARTVLSGLTKETQIFVVEMGAYKKGEIKQMCQMVHPQIGVLTAVSPQHLSLFGSIENTMAAKYELIDSLPADGLALFNGDNENAKLLFEKTKRKKVLYSIDGKKREGEGEIRATAIAVLPESTSFTVIQGIEKLSLTVPLVGMQNVTNILPAVFLADHLGMTHEQIKKAVSSLHSIPKTMSVKKTKKNAYFVDDTFNANPEAVLAAIDYALIGKGKKILVMQPMIELGPMGRSEHRRVAVEIGRVCDYLLLTNKNFYEEIREGITEGKGECTVIVGTKNELSEILRQKVEKEDIVIFEGKEAGFVLQRIESYV